MDAVDLNCDAGEGFGPWRMGDDAALLDVVTTVNVACGMHAGDPVTMTRTVDLAAARGVAVGAHPGYDDLRGFGRRRILGDAPEDVAALVLYQVGALRALAGARGVPVGHAKLHGALNNVAAVDIELAAAIAAALAAYDADLAWLVPSGSAMAVAGERAGLRVVHEAFCDRGYAADGTLMPRAQPGAVLDDPAAIAARAVSMVRDQSVVAGDGSRIPLRTESLCVHGDGRDAASVARAVRRALEGAGIAVRSFARR